MTSDDGMDPLLRHVGVTGRYVTAAQVEQLARIAIVDDALHDEFMSAVLVACDAEWEDGARPASDELSMRVGGWRLDMTRVSIRAGLMTSIVAGALVQQGLTEIAIAVVTAVIPSVVDIERVKLGAGDHRLLLELRLDPDVRAGELTEDELYSRLPETIREVVNPYDFADFIQRLRDAGLASGGLRTALLDPENRRPWISLR